MTAAFATTPSVPNLRFDGRQTNSGTIVVRMELSDQQVAYVACQKKLLNSYGERLGYLRATLRLVATEAGGKPRIVTTGYRSNWHWGDRTAEGLLVVHDAPLMVEGRDWVESGEEAIVRLYPMHPDYWASASPGFEMDLCEESRVVGRATILDRVPPSTTCE